MLARLSRSLKIAISMVFCKGFNLRRAAAQIGDHSISGAGSGSFHDANCDHSATTIYKISREEARSGATLPGWDTITAHASRRVLTLRPKTCSLFTLFTISGGRVAPFPCSSEALLGGFDSLLANRSATSIPISRRAACEPRPSHAAPLATGRVVFVSISRQRSSAVTRALLPLAA